MATKAAAMITGRKKASRKKYSSQPGMTRWSARARISPTLTLKVTAKNAKRSVFQKICSERRSVKKRTKLSKPTQDEPRCGSK